MATDHYSGKLIVGLQLLVDEVAELHRLRELSRLTPKLRIFQLQNSIGQIYGCQVEMLEDEAEQRNTGLRDGRSDYRWCIAGERPSIFREVRR